MEHYSTKFGGNLITTKKIIMGQSCTFLVELLHTKTSNISTTLNDDLDMLKYFVATTSVIFRIIHYRGIFKVGSIVAYDFP